MAWTQVQRSGKYAALYRDREGKIRSAGTFTHKKPAKEAANAAEVAARSAGWRDPKAAQRTWEDWQKEWWPTRAVEPGTLARDRSSLTKYLLPRWGDVPLADITRFDVKAWVKTMTDAGLAPATARRHLYVFSASLAAAMDKEVIASNPAFKIQVMGGQAEDRRYLKGVELERVLEQFDGVHEAMVMTQFGGGMRFGEVSGLQIPRVDLEANTITVAEVWDHKMNRLKPYPKGRRRRSVPIPDWMRPHLEQQIGDRKEGLVFLAPRGGVVTYQNFRNRVWVPAVKAAGVPTATDHDLRHTYASMLVQNGVPLAVIGNLLGHQSPQTTAGYADLEGLPADPILSKYAAGVTERLGILALQMHSKPAI